MSNPTRLDSGSTLSQGVPKGQSDYLHRCLALFATVTEIRYGKRQRLEELERNVQNRLAVHPPLWEVVHAIYDSPDFDAYVFGPLHGERIEDDLRRTAGREWWSLPHTELAKILYGAFRQIEPVSVVMRFICPKRFGIMSSLVTTLVGVRPKRRAIATYDAYVKSLREIGDSHGIKRVADVDMALWALQVGVLDKRLPEADRGPLKREYDKDRQLRQLAVRNLTKQLFSERGELDVAEALLDTKPALAGGLDDYFLWKERLYRAFYDHARTLDEASIDFSTDTTAFKTGYAHAWLGATLSRTLLFFCGMLAVMVGGATLVPMQGN